MAAHRFAHSLNTLGCCLILATLFASSAKAAEIGVEAGTPGSNASDFSFFMPPGDNDLVFFDGEALVVSGDPPVMSFILSAGPAVQFNGFLTDQLGEKIPGTEYAGIVSVDAASVELPPGTVWYGMRLSGAFVPGNYVLLWNPPNPRVVPEPGATACGLAALTALAALAGGRPRRAAASRRAGRRCRLLSDGSQRRRGRKWQELRD